jgi:hypothetical protein
MLFRFAAWVFIAVLVWLTIAPPLARPDSGVPHDLEPFASFFIAGALWYMGYSRRLLLCLPFVVLFAGWLELLQMLLPGRHARILDFVVDALGTWTGNTTPMIRGPTRARIRYNEAFLPATSGAARQSRPMIVHTTMS